MGVPDKDKLYTANELQIEIGYEPETLLEQGLIREQRIDGKVFYRVTQELFEKFAEICEINPRYVAQKYWEFLVQEQKGATIEEFLIALSLAHREVKEITDGIVDLCYYIVEFMNE